MIRSSVKTRFKGTSCVLSTSHFKLLNYPSKLLINSQMKLSKLIVIDTSKTRNILSCCTLRIFMIMLLFLETNTDHHFLCLSFTPIILFNTCFEFSCFWVNVVTIVQRIFKAHVFTVIISLNFNLPLDFFQINSIITHTIRYSINDCNSNRRKVIVELK